jgi:hypothetical protein
MPPVNRRDLLRQAAAAGLGVLLGRSLEWLPAAPALEAVPTLAVSTGSFLYLDQRTLEFGIVRDSLLRDVYDYKVYGETFESAAVLSA